MTRVLSVRLFLWGNSVYLPGSKAEAIFSPRVKLEARDRERKGRKSVVKRCLKIGTYLGLG